MKTLTIFALLAFALVVPVLGQKRARHRVAEVDPLTEVTGAERPDADGWVLIASSDETFFRYRPGKTIRPAANIREFWIKSDFAHSLKEQSQVIEFRTRLNLNVKGYDHYVYNMGLWKVDCRLQRYTLERTVEYDVFGRVLDDYAGPRGAASPVPDSVGEIIVTKICSSK